MLTCLETFKWNILGYMPYGGLPYYAVIATRWCVVMARSAVKRAIGQQ